MSRFRCTKCVGDHGGCEVECFDITSIVPGFCPFDGTTVCDFKRITKL